MAMKLQWLLMIPVLAAVGICCYYSVYLPSLIRDNEREASKGLKSLTSADADFRANDRDWNHVNDFWTGDVAGLFCVKGGEKRDQEVRLIDRAIAEADIRPLTPIVAAPVPYHGYFFIALDEDDGLEGTQERFYKVDTGGSPTMGKVHSTSKFGFCAYPAKYGVTGKFTFLVNENNTVFRGDTGGKPMTHFPKDDSPPAHYHACPDLKE